MWGICRHVPKGFTCERKEGSPPARSFATSREAGTDELPDVAEKLAIINRYSGNYGSRGSARSVAVCITSSIVFQAPKEVRNTDPRKSTRTL